MAFTTAQVNGWYQAVQFRDGPTAAVNSYVSLLNSGGLTAAQVQAAVINDTYTFANANTVIRLYQAAFARVADQSGQNYWVDIMGATPDAQKTAQLQAIATQFANSTEFVAEYGVNASAPINAAVLTAFYANVLNRTPDTAGFNYWLNSGQTTSQVLNAFAQSAEFTTASSSATTLFQQAQIAGTASTSGSLFQYGGFPVTDIVLTTNIDIINEGSNVNVIGQFADPQTIQTGDQITLSGLNDNATFFGDFSASRMPTIFNGVENFTLSNYGNNKTINLSAYSGTTAVTLAAQATQGAGDTTLTLNGTQNLTLNTVQDSGNAANELIVASSVSTRASLGLTLNAAGDDGTGGNDLELTLNLENMTALSVNTTGAGSRITLGGSSDGTNFNSLQTITVTGNQQLIAAVQATDASQGFLTINGSAATAALQIDASDTGNFRITGGSGNDKFIFGSAFNGSDRVNGGGGTNTLSTSTATVNSTFAGYIDGTTSGVANNSNIQVLEYTGTGSYVLDASLIQLSTLNTYTTTAAITGTAGSVGSGASAGSTGAVGVAVTGEANSQFFSLEANVTGGVGGAGTAGSASNGGAGADGATFAPAVNNGNNELRLTLSGALITGGAGGAGGGSGATTGGAGGDGADFTNFETVYITSTGSTSSAVNRFVAGAGGASGAAGGGADGAAGTNIVANSNVRFVIDGANELNMGTISNSNGPTTVDASALTGDLTVSTGTAADTLTGGSNNNTFTLAGGSDSINITRSTALSDSISWTNGTNITVANPAQITGFTNAGSSTVGDVMKFATAFTIQADVAAGTATGVTNLTGAVNSGIMTFGGSAAATATLADLVTAASSANFAAAVDEGLAFQYNSATYVFWNNDGITGFDDGDVLVQLIGVTGVTSLSNTASGANQIYVTAI